MVVKGGSSWQFASSSISLCIVYWAFVWLINNLLVNYGIKIIYLKIIIIKIMWPNQLLLNQTICLDFIEQHISILFGFILP